MTQPIKVNFTNEEASSRVRDVPPSGEYVVNITDVKSKSVKPGKANSGKPFWQLTLVIQDGAYAGVSLLSSVMLFDGALYSCAQLMTALGHNINEGGFVLPSAETLLGKTVIVKGYKRPAGTTPDGQDLAERFEVKGFKPFKGGSASKSADSSLLPK